MRFVYDAGIVVYRGAGGGRRFLFLRRSDGWLDMPKGHIEKGERAEEAAIRETREEAGVEATPDPFFRDGVEYWYVENGEKTKKQVTFFIAEVGEGAKVMVSREHAGYEWLAYDAAMRRVSFKDQKELLSRVGSYLERLDAMRALNKRYAALPSKCRAWKLSRRLVPGEGPLDAEVMFIGQAPGRQENDQRRPFVGTSGKLLNRMIRIAGLERGKVYITSVVQFFPPENRMPTGQEIAACKRFLLGQIGIVKPKLIVLLGAIAAKTLAGVESVMSGRGKLAEAGGRRFFITLHPAAAVRLKKLVPPMEADFRKLGGLKASL